VSRPTNNHNNFLVFNLIKNAKILEQTIPLDMGRGGNANHNQSTDSGRIYFWINRRLGDRYRELLRLEQKKLKNAKNRGQPYPLGMGHMFSKTGF
jgi:hypothetical protein